MNVQPIKKVARIRKTYKEAHEIPQPKHYCSTCAKLKSDKTCILFERRVEPDYNRCFFHSYYSPIEASFKVSANLEEIIKEEEKRMII